MSGFMFSVDAMVLFDVVPHLWIGAGPALAYTTADVETDDEGLGSGTIESTAYGLGIEVGGWF